MLALVAWERASRCVAVRLLNKVRIAHVVLADGGPAQEVQKGELMRVQLAGSKRRMRCFKNAYRPGMYVLLKVPSVACGEWHAFTVCSGQAAEHWVSLAR